MEDEPVEQLNLELDKTSNVFGIDPHLLAAVNEEFFIFSPTSKNYLFMSKDPSFGGSLHTKLEARSKRDSRRNFFKLIKAEGKNAFYLKNVQTEKFVHSTGEHVLGASGELSEHENKSNFLFEFEAVAGDTCYRVKNDGKYLFISKTTAGIPPNNVVHAGKEVNDNSDIFQFVLEKNAKSANVEFDLTAVKKTSSVLETFKFEFKNEENEDKIDEPSLKKEYPSTEKFVFKGLTYIGSYIGGHIAQQAATMGYILLSENIPRSILVEDVKTVDNSFKITTSPGKTSILDVVVTEYILEAPVKIHLTTANKKTLTADGMWTNNSGLFVSSKLSSEPPDDCQETTDK